jgi:hypothetical protein
MSNANDKFDCFPAETADPIGKYKQPRPYTAATPNTGYPNATPNTQTMVTRGSGAATRGNKSSTKLG